MLQQCASHVHHVHQRERQFSLAAVLVSGGFLGGGCSAAQQGDGVFLGLVAGYAFVQGPDSVVQGGPRWVGVEVIVERAACGFAVEICFVVFR
mgnify:CR=1 FL=1